MKYSRDLTAAREDAAAFNQFVELFQVKDTPDLLSIIGEDQWITVMRDMYHRIHRRFDDGVDLKQLLREQIAAALSKAKERQP